MKRILKLIAFGAVFISLFIAVQKALSFKDGDGIWGIKAFYEQDEDSIDMLVLGSSHAFEDINTGVLFDSYGIAAYVLAGSVQPYWNTYYYLEEALKTQTPKLVLLEAYGSVFTDEYSDNSRIVKNNFGIKSIDTLWKSLRVSCPKEEFTNYFFQYRLWHSRYSELGKSDFSAFYHTPQYMYFKGDGINYETQERTMPQVDDVTEESPMSEKTEEYYRKIIELCIAEEIPVMIVVSPYEVTLEEQMKYNYASRIAAEYEVDFINFNFSKWYERMELDFSQDMADFAHLNFRGNAKYTHALAEEILERYSLPDRRDSDAYFSWSMHSKDTLQKTDNLCLKAETDVDKYIRGIAREDSYIAVIMLSDTPECQIQEKLSVIKGMDQGRDTQSDGVCMVVRDGELIYKSAGSGWSHHEFFRDHFLKLEQREEEASDGGRSLKCSMVWKEKEYINTSEGCYLFVYDDFTQNLIGISHIYVGEDGNCLIKHL